MNDDSFERLEKWVAWRIGRKLTHDERQQLVNLVRGIVGDVLTVAKDLVGKPHEHHAR